MFSNENTLLGAAATATEEPASSAAPFSRILLFSLHSDIRGEQLASLTAKARKFRKRGENSNGNTATAAAAAAVSRKLHF